MTEYPCLRVKHLGPEGFLEAFEEKQSLDIKIITGGDSHLIAVPFGSFYTWVRNNRDLAYRMFALFLLEDEFRLVRSYDLLANRAYRLLSNATRVLGNRWNQESGEQLMIAPQDIIAQYSWRGDNQEAEISDPKIHFLLSGLLKRPEDQFLKTVVGLGKTTLMAVIPTQRPTDSPVFVYAKVEPKTIRAGLLVVNPDGLSAWLKEQGLKEGQYTIQ